MDIETTISDAITFVNLRGELRREGTEAFTEAMHELLTHPGSRVAVDLSEITLIDSSGLSALMNAVTRARLGGSEVVLVNPSGFVAGVFEATRLDTWFEILADADAARRRFRT